MNIKQLNSRARTLSVASASALAIGVLCSGNTYAADATSPATATVVEPIAISNSVDLAFGKFSAGTGGTVVISTAGARSATSGVVLLNADEGSAAVFGVTGDTGATYAITLPTSAVTITHTTDATKTMSIDSFTSNPLATGTLTAGAETINVGGTLTVVSAQTPGSYTGEFTVSVGYN